MRTSRLRLQRSGRAGWQSPFLQRLLPQGADDRTTRRSLPMRSRGLQGKSRLGIQRRTPHSFTFLSANGRSARGAHVIVCASLFSPPHFFPPPSSLFLASLHRPLFAAPVKIESCPARALLFSVTAAQAARRKGGTQRHRLVVENHEQEMAFHRRARRSDRCPHARKRRAQIDSGSGLFEC